MELLGIKFDPKSFVVGPNKPTEGMFLDYGKEIKNISDLEKTNPEAHWFLMLLMAAATQDFKDLYNRNRKKILMRAGSTVPYTFQDGVPNISELLMQAMPNTGTKATAINFVIVRSTKNVAAKAWPVSTTWWTGLKEI